MAFFLPLCTVEQCTDCSFSYNEREWGQMLPSCKNVKKALQSSHISIEIPHTVCDPIGPHIYPQPNTGQNYLKNGWMDGSLGVN